ncbi:hypothetical protein KKE14_00425 [Patescibacteria group bacterium]|nr:hypothetical protein [Patescibacteria group bacterium]
MCATNIKFKLGQTVRVIKRGENSSVSRPEDLGHIGKINSIATYGSEDPRYILGVTFDGDAENVPPRTYTPEQLELLVPKFI